MKLAPSSIFIKATFDFGQQSEVLLFKAPQALIELLDKAMNLKRHAGKKHEDDHDHGVH